jgi:DNA polymerase III epsilon subunit-like protein
VILDPIVYFDLETGGLEVTSPIIQIAAVAVRPNGCGTADFECKLNFDRAAADPEALAINHYDPEVWSREQVPVLTGLTNFARWIQAWRTISMVSKRNGRPYMVTRLAGYNAAVFDMPMLMLACKTAGVFLPAHPVPLDVMQLALWHFQGYKKRPESFKLADVCKFCGVALEGAHDALADVRATAALAAALTNPVPEEASAGWEPETGGR